MPKHRSTCEVDACPSKHWAKGYCHKHYARWKRHGDPLVTFPNRVRHTQETTRRTWLKTRYGITPEDYDRMLAEQGGCGICGTPTPGGRGGFHVDHDHATGEVRGLLCFKCNSAIGLLNDDAGLVEQALRWLR